LRASVLYAKLPEMRKTVSALEKRIVELEKRIEGESAGGGGCDA